ncbi:MAG TPA: dihydroxyacetone kinase subunit DhaL [Rugosimonospora sp.]|nr:dihydroxyacetone kinase subunit DhaL [Rugosimonospora sp.]
MTSLRHAVLTAADTIEAAQEDLGALDRVAGDGDHGVTMATAARNVRARLRAAPDLAGADLLREVALGVASVGGASGPIYATALLRIAAVVPDTPVTPATLLAAAEAAEDGIMALGKAKPGDKTLLDALHPLVESLRASVARGSDLPSAVSEAAAAAQNGAASTADMVATLGRASRLGERSRGSADPGATSLAVIVSALAASYAHDRTG